MEVILEGATKFTEGLFDVFWMGMIYDRSSLITRNDEDGVTDTNTRLNATAMDAVRYGLQKWKNHQDPRVNDLALAFVAKIVVEREYQRAAQ